MDGNKHCLVCLEQVPIRLAGRMRAHSLKYVFRYLKMDNMKVFRDVDDVIPTRLPLLDKLDKVIFCDTCSPLILELSGIFRQLEKMEMKMASCLNCIHLKFLGAEETTDGVERYSFTEAERSVAMLEEIRKKMMQKCSQKLKSLSPRVKLEKIYTNPLNQEELRIQSTCHVVSTEQRIIQQSNLDAGRDLKIDIGDIKVERANEDEEDSFDDMVLDCQQHDSSINTDKAQPKELAKVEDGESAKIPSTRRQAGRRTKTSFIKQDQFQLHQRFGNCAAPKSSRPAKKHRCEVCGKCYTQPCHLKHHFKIAHLKSETFACSLCSRVFPRLYNLQTHFKSLHSEIREHGCKLCGKGFKTKWDLKVHQRIHWGGNGMKQK